MEGSQSLRRARDDLGGCYRGSGCSVSFLNPLRFGRFGLTILAFAACSTTPTTLLPSLPGATESSIATTGAAAPSMPDSTPRTTDPSQSVPSLTFDEQPEPIEVTTFSASNDCDPSDDDADLQVVHAFVTAYNERSIERLEALTTAPIPGGVTDRGFVLTDMSGIPHLGEDDWLDVGDWAQKGWAVNDLLTLTRLVRYGKHAGSVFDLMRSNDVLLASGIQAVNHSGKVHSSGCYISQMVLYLPYSEDSDSPECVFWDVFNEKLKAGTTQDIARPLTCSPAGS